MIKPHFQTFAAYNKWADTTLYDACEGLSEEVLNRDVGVYFSSLMGTLNHLVVTDRVWLSRLTGQGTHPPTLDTIITTDLAALRRLAMAEADRLIGWVDSQSSDELNAPFDYHTMNGTAHNKLHRSQVTTCLNILGVEPPVLDMLDFQRG